MRKPHSAILIMVSHFSELYRAEVLIPLIAQAREKFGDRAFTLQQDGAPSHSAEVNQKWLRDQGVDFIEMKNRRKISAFSDQWPACSPDLSPNDYSINGIMAQRVGAKGSESIAQLTERIKREWKRLPQKVIKKAVDHWPKRLQRCIDAKGKRFE